MTELDCRKQYSGCKSTRGIFTDSESDDEFDLLIDALGSIDNKLNCIDINTRQCEDEIHTVVRPDGNVVTVHLQISISSIEDVDTVRQEFTCQFYLGVSWEEPQLKDDAKEGRKIEWEKCWDPRIYFQNAVEVISMTSSTKLLQPLYDGNPSVQISYRVKGKFKTLFDLRNFPFDKQLLQICIVSKWGDSVVQLKEASYKPGYLCCKTFLCEHEWVLYKHVIGTESCTAEDCSNDHSLSPDCDITSSEVHCRHRIVTFNQRNSSQKGIMKKPFNDERPLVFSVFTFSFSIRRKFSFFISNVVVLLAIISFLALGPFCVPQSEIGDRLSIIFTLLLTAVTFKFVVSQSLPRVSYQTLLDQYVLSCIVYIFAMSVIIGSTTKIPFLQQHESFTVIVSFCLWLLITSWIAFTSIATVKSSNVELQRLENMFRSRSNQSAAFQCLADAGINDLMLPKSSPDIVPLRISESTASAAALPQYSLSHTIMDKANGLMLIRERADERRSTLANIHLRKKNLKARKGKERFNKRPRRGRLISHENKSTRIAPNGEVNDALLSRSSSFLLSKALGSHEIVLGRYTASFDKLEQTSDNVSMECEVFTQDSSGQGVAEDLNMQNSERIRSLSSQG